MSGSAVRSSARARLASMGFIQTTINGWNASTARSIYRLARKLAGGDEMKFRTLVVSMLASAGFDIPKKLR